MGVLDEVLNYILPGHMQKVYSAKRTYQAAQPSPYSTSAWRTTTESPDGSVAGGVGPILRQQGRYLDENLDLATGVLNHLVDEVVGKGIEIEPMVSTRSGKPLERVNDQIRDLLDQFYESPEVTRELPMQEFQALLCRSWCRDGEVFLRHVVGRQSYEFGPEEVPYLAQGIETDMCPFGLIEESPYIVMGIEKDAQWNFAKAYYFFKQHPGQSSSIMGALFPTGGTGMINLSEVNRVPADLVEHCKMMNRLGMTRGVSVFASVMRRLEDLKDYEESERIAARVSASFCAAITRSNDLPVSSSGEMGDRAFNMMPGQVFENLLPGESVTDIGSSRPSDALEPFRNAMLRAVAAGTGAKYSSVSKNYAEGSYSSQRQELVEARPHFERLQEYFISKVMRPMYERFIEAARLDGQLMMSRDVDPASLTRAAYLTPALAWIDPKKELEAYILEHDNGLISKSEIMVKRGRNPRVVHDQLELEEEVEGTEPAPPLELVDNEDDAA